MLCRLVGDLEGEWEGEGEMSVGGGNTGTGRNPLRLGTNSRCFKEPMTFRRLLLDIVILLEHEQDVERFI